MPWLVQSAFRSPVFVLIWTANTVALIGIAMFDASAGWLVTRMSVDPFLVSLVQTATMAPMFLLTLPAGAVADVIDPRRLLILNSLLIASLMAVFATLVTGGLATPALLLSTVFVLSGAWAVNAPAWLAIIPSLVPPEQLDSAIAANGIGYNASRAVGPAIAGVAIAVVGIAAPFWTFCAINLATVAALLAWKGSPPRLGALPPERIVSAMRIGVRHAFHNPHLKATIVRALAIYPFASAYWSLLPLIARQAHGQSEFYGTMLALIAIGSVAGSLALAPLKGRVGPDRAVALATVVACASLATLGASHDRPVVLATCFLSGGAWMIALASLYVSAQDALPAWVRARGIAIFLTVIFGAVSSTSAIWGMFASISSPSTALYVAAAGLLAGIPLSWRWKLQTGAQIDRSPSLHWRPIKLAKPISDSRGPVLVTLDYRVKPAEKEAFLEAIQEMGDERKRDGAKSWAVYEDVELAGRFLETFDIESWVDLRRLRERVTKADRDIEVRIERMLSRPRRARFHVAASAGC